MIKISKTMTQCSYLATVKTKTLAKKIQTQVEVKLLIKIVISIIRLFSVLLLLHRVLKKLESILRGSKQKMVGHPGQGPIPSQGYLTL